MPRLGASLVQGLKTMKVHCQAFPVKYSGAVGIRPDLLPKVGRESHMAFQRLSLCEAPPGSPPRTVEKPESKKRKKGVEGLVMSSDR